MWAAAKSTDAWHRGRNPGGRSVLGQLRPLQCAVGPPPRAVGAVCADPVGLSGGEYSRTPFLSNSSAPDPHSLGDPPPCDCPKLRGGDEGRVWAGSRVSPLLLHLAPPSVPVPDQASATSPRCTWCPLASSCNVKTAPLQAAFLGRGWNFEDGFPSFLP